jgi:hypothetical protein
MSIQDFVQNLYRRLVGELVPNYSGYQPFPGGIWLNSNLVFLKIQNPFMPCFATV